MEKKNGFNIMFFVLIIISIMNFSCIKNTRSAVAGVLLQVDRDFSAMSEKEGMHKAFIAFAADSTVMLRNNFYPLVGREALVRLFSTRSDTAFTLTWEPVFERISEGGDLGYTYGISASLIKATGEVRRGTYVSIWQKQNDGSWKFVLDTGTQGLPEKPE